MKGLPYLLMCMFLLTFSLAKAGDNHADTTKVEFNTVDFIFNHVNDSYEWHFFSIGHTHVSVPLPVILYSQETGLNIFFSNKLHEEDPNFKFQLQHGGKYDGKVVEKLSNGEIVRPFDMSITKSVLGIIVISLLIVITSITAARQAQRNPNSAPKGLQNMIEPLVEFVRDDIAKEYIGEHYQKFLPYLITLFFFVLTGNMLGLVLPLGFNVTGNIAITLVLATLTFLITLFSSNKQYWKHIFNPDVPMFMKFPIPMMPFIEFLGMLIKPVVLMIRLFANMFSGHMIVTVLVGLIFIIANLLGAWAAAGTSVVSVIFSAFMMLIDILVSFIQAYIFTLLSALYFGSACQKGH